MAGTGWYTGLTQCLYSALSPRAILKYSSLSRFTMGPIWLVPTARWSI